MELQSNHSEQAQSPNLEEEVELIKQNIISLEQKVNQMAHKASLLEVQEQSQDNSQKLLSLNTMISRQSLELSQLQEVTALKRQRQSVVYGLAQQVSYFVEETLMPKVMTVCIAKKDFAEYQVNMEQMLRRLQQKAALQDNQLMQLEQTVNQASQKQLDDHSELKYQLMRMQLEINDKVPVDDFQKELIKVKSKYSTKAELEQVQEQLNSYALQSQVEEVVAELCNQLKSLEASVSDSYYTKLSIDEQLGDFQSRSDQTYQTIKGFDEGVSKLLSQVSKIKSQLRVHGNTLKEHADNTQKCLKTLDTKAEVIETKSIRNELQKFAQYDDLKGLYRKVLPPLAKYEDKMNEFSKEHEQSKEIIRRYDEVIANKASKVQIKEVYQYLQKYATQTSLDDNETQSNQKISDQAQNLSRLEETLKIITDSISKDIHTAVRKAAISFQNQGQGEFGNSKAEGIGVLSADLKSLLSQKADKKDIETVLQLKSNKVDVEQAMKGVDILHKQVTHLVVLMIELTKTSLQNYSDSDKQRQKQRMFILELAVKVCQWVQRFNPQHINNDDLILPTDLKSLQDHAVVLAQEFPKLDNVAQQALRKHRARELSFQGAIRDSSVMLHGEMTHSNSPCHKRQQGMLPSQRLNKYINMSISTSRNEKDQNKIIIDANHLKPKQMLQTGRYRRGQINPFLKTKLEPATSQLVTSLQINDSMEHSKDNGSPSPGNQSQDYDSISHINLPLLR